MTHKGLAILLTSLAPLIAGSLTAVAQLNTFHSTMTLVYPSPLVLKPPSGFHKSTLIFLHGLGDTGSCHDQTHLYQARNVQLTRASQAIYKIILGLQGQAGQMWENLTLQNACAIQRLSFLQHRRCYPFLHPAPRVGLHHVRSKALTIQLMKGRISAEVHLFKHGHEDAWLV